MRDMLISLFAKCLELQSFVPEKSTLESVLPLESRQELVQESSTHAPPAPDPITVAAVDSPAVWKVPNCAVVSNVFTLFSEMFHLNCLQRDIKNCFRRYLLRADIL